MQLEKNQRVRPLAGGHLLPCSQKQDEVGSKDFLSKDWFLLPIPFRGKALLGWLCLFFFAPSGSIFGEQSNFRWVLLRLWMVEGQRKKQEGPSLTRHSVGSHLPGLCAHPCFVCRPQTTACLGGLPLCEQHSEDRVSLVNSVAMICNCWSLEAPEGTPSFPSRPSRLWSNTTHQF